MPTLETVTGRIIDPEYPVSSNIDIHDIAWSLSRISRFSGHTVTEIPYNVAQHCIFVADMMIEFGHSKKLALYGLLHDAAEYAIGDIPSPVKKIPALRAVLDPIELNILNTIYTKYVGDPPTDEEWQVVKKFDKRAQFIEAWNFMASRGIDWPDRDKHEISLVDIQNFPAPIPSIVAHQKFIEKFNQLTLWS
jgi:5'-deoxynucleotidase YfbR-like HD superfamily hydrolase